MVRLGILGPIIAVDLTMTISLCGVYCSLMWWPPAESLGGFLCLTLCLCFIGIVSHNLISVITIGPGYLPLGWVPPNDEDRTKLQFCTPCNGFKAPRAHHCSKCGRCVLKRVHHCPWLNNCVGHRNHAHFVFFLVFVLIGCTLAATVLSCSLYCALHPSYYNYHKADVPIVYLSEFGQSWVIFSIGSALGVAMGVTILLCYQLKGIFKNQTRKENWIIKKAQERRKKCPKLPPFIHPYGFDWKQNFKFVMNFACEPIGDGIKWKVVPECDEYSLTVEQIQQENDKLNELSKEYTVIEDYNGAWCPISKGLGIFFLPPIFDKSRITLTKGERITVTSWKRYWLYGQLVNKNRNIDAHAEKKIVSPEVKGWFPRRCVLEIIDSDGCKDKEDESSPQSPVQVPQPDSPGKKKKN